jgi:hypothetical protein
MMHRDQEKLVDVNNTTTRDVADLLLADYWGGNVYYLIEDFDLNRFTKMEIKEPELDPRIAGQAIFSDGKDQILFSVYSLHTDKVEDCYFPVFSKSCFFRVKDKIFDLHKPNITTKWTDGLLKRKFEIIEDDEVVFEHTYIRPAMG